MTAVTYRPTDPELREEMISTVRGFVARDVIPVASELAPDQVVEVVLKLMGFSSDKAMVALGLDFDEVRTFTM